MSQQTRFYLQHTYNNLRRNLQRTLFVLFCIAAGVAAIVSLRTLGLMIETALTENLQADLKSDIIIGPSSAERAEIREQPIDPELVVEGGQFQPTTFSTVGLDRISQWATDNGYTAAPIRREFAPIQARRAVDPDGAESISLIFIDTDNYPFYNDLLLTAPTSNLVRESFNDPLDIVITEKLAADLDLAIGDKMRLSGSRDEFTVVGTVEDSAEASLSDPSTLLFTFAYLDFKTGQERFNRTATEIAIQLDAGADVVEVEEQFLEAFPGLRTRTTEDLRETNASITEELTRLITLMGLVSLLIGGIGIINTMLVVVRRRALEIGVLKTVGVQGRQITLMFMIEAFVLGIIGSSLGCVLGLGLTKLLQTVGERVAARELAFGIYPEAIAMGMVTGTVVTLVFGFLPTLAAGRVRPNIVLNPSADNPIPNAGRLQSAIVLAILVLIMGLLVGVILDNMLNGVLYTYAVFFGIGVLGLLMWVLVLVVTRIPSFGSIRFKLIQRAMETQASRTASTLLALTIGMFALSIILLFTGAVISLLEVSYSQEIGGNIVAFGQTEQASQELQDVAESLPGIRNIEYTETYQGELFAINGDEDLDTLFEAAREIGVAQEIAELEAFDDLSVDEQEEKRQDERIGVNFRLQFFRDSLTVQVPEDDLTYEVAEGDLLSADSTASIVLPYRESNDWFGFEIGDTLTYEYNDGELQTLTIVGIMPELTPRQILRYGIEANIPAGGVVSADVINENIDPEPLPILIDAEEATLDETVDALAAVENSFVFETSLIQNFIIQLIEQLTALPVAVAILSLFASAVIILNTVSLATLERRREIGIMKAIGLQSSQVLSLLLLENGFLGLMGGILGCSIGTALSVFALLSDTTGAAQFPILTLIGLLLLAVGIAVFATLVTAVGAAREKPLIVLRYE